MRVRDVRRVQARISPKVLADAQQQIVDKMKGTGSPETRQIKISEVMSLKLSGQDFRVTSYSEDKQQILDPYTTWEWDIEALTGGKKTLSLSIVTYAEEATSQAPVSSVEDWTVTVQVSPRQRAGEFLSSNWQWLGTVVVLPILAWGIREFNNRRVRSGRRR
jgi:hypothetical protein